MSKNLERVIQRAISDAAFRRQLQSNPEAALRGLNLTAGEVAALRSGDATKLTSLGIDQRMSKTFSFGGDSLASRSSIGGDLTSSAGTDRDMRQDTEVAGGSNTMVDPENTSGATRLVVPGSAGGNAAFDPGIVGGNTSVGDPLLETSGSSVIADPDNPASARTYTGGQSAPTSDAMEDQSHSFAASRSADVGGSNIGYGANYPEHGGLAGQSADVGGSNVAYGANYPEHGGLAGQSADLAASTPRSVIGDPDNPVNARGFIGDQGGSSATASTIGDPDNPASARTFTGGEAASTSDAIEDQSHAFTASRDQGASGATASTIGDPDNPASARTFTGGEAASTSDAIEDQSHAFAASRDQGASGATASTIGDPDNPASARTFTGGEAASTSDAIEDQSHAFAASRDQGASGATASSISDPDNPGFARGYTGGEVAPTSDAIEDQSHAIAASRGDAFLTEGEVSQYSTDPNWSSDQAEDAGHAFNPDSATLPDDGGTATQHHEPDVPS